MSRIALAWELGGGYGHLSHLLPVADGLLGRRHEVVAIVKDVSGTESWAPHRGIRAVQAPVWLASTRGLPPPASYPELLFRFGYLEVGRLTAMVRAWHELIDLLGPDLVVADHAPTALLAARLHGLPRVLLGTGFSIPPRLSPMPSMVPWERVPEARLVEAERRALAVVNATLDRFGAAPLAALHEVLDADAAYLATYEELDHYEAREGARYLGTLERAPDGAAPEWPAGPGARVFCYLRPGYAGLPGLLEVMRGLAHRFLLHVPGLSPQLARRHTRANTRFSADPLDMELVGERADLVLCHGGANTVAAALRAGRPLVVLPTQHEQRMLGRRLAAQALGRTVEDTKQARGFASAIERVLSDSGYAERARAFAARYADLDPAAASDEVVARCDALCQTRPEAAASPDNTSGRRLP